MRWLSRRAIPSNSKKVLSSEGKTLSFDLPITTDSQPNLDVSAVFIENDQMYQASKQIKVPPVQQQLQVEIAPASQVFQPQQTAAYDVYTRDYQGKPVSADMSFGVVDEALYSIYPDSCGDILKRLYPARYTYAPFDSSLQYYFSGRAGLKSPMLAERQSRYRPQLAQVKPGNDVSAAEGAQGISGHGILVSKHTHRYPGTCARYSHLP